MICTFCKHEGQLFRTTALSYETKKSENDFQIVELLLFHNSYWGSSSLAGCICPKCGIVQIATYPKVEEKTK